MKRVLILTAMLAVSACATNIDFDLSGDDAAVQDGVPTQDPMIEDNERIMEDARERGKLER